MPDLDEVLGRADAVAERVGPYVTTARFRHLAPHLTIIHGEAREHLQQYGISLHGRLECEFILPAVPVRLGNVTVHNQGRGSTIVLLATVAPRECNLVLRLQADFCLVVFPDLSVSPLNLPTISLRSERQIFFWGQKSTSVTSRVEMEGPGAMIAIGDDCMFSSGVWLRNHDMHAIFEIASGDIVNAAPGDMILQQHVWLGFEAFLLGPTVIGYGSIVGARSLINRDLAPKSLAVGTPARVVRSGVSWSRNATDVPKLTTSRLASLDDLAAI